MATKIANRSRATKRGVVLRVCVTPADARLLRETAKYLGRSVSAFLRDSGLAKSQALFPTSPGVPA